MLLHHYQGWNPTRIYIRWNLCGCALTKLVRVVVSQVGGDSCMPVDNVVNILVEVRIQRHNLWTHHNHEICVRFPTIKIMLRENEVGEISLLMHVLY